MKIKILFLFVAAGLLVSRGLQAQTRPYRVGTTTASFLEMGVGSAGCAMGEAYVGHAQDLSSVYWNPAGLSYMAMNELQFIYQPWIAGIQFTHAAASLNLPGYGTFALSFTGMNFGTTPVTSMEMQEGTGESYSAMDMAAGLSYGRKLAQWFGFGASVKYITSGIWHMRAGAAAVDLGVMVSTDFFSPDGKRENGLRIGMSISNYGTRMRYEGMDLLQPIDISGDAGNFKNVEGQFRVQSWELPLIFRFGISLIPLQMGPSRLCLTLDALHPNNNSESINVGGEYQWLLSGLGKLFLRAGYRGLFMDESEYGLTLGGGVHVHLMNNRALKMDYAYRSMGVFGNFSMFGIGMTF
ncbi:PorV/PorQ family protein [bacterium]|nr:PorV/PorQ family protein [bacterium]